MCRLFCKISKKESNANFWMFKADPAFENFSKDKIGEGPHNSGWGVGWLKNNSWKIFKEGKDNVKKFSFNKVKKVSSKIIFIHLRKASVGDEETKNAHPFTYKNFIFEHNGYINRNCLLRHLNKEYKKHLTSKTDSEAFFLLLMQYFDKIKNMEEAITETINIVKKYPHKGLNFILSNGKKVWAYRSFSEKVKDKEHYYVLHYLKEKDSIILSSNPLSKAKWIPLKIGELIVINPSLRITKINLGKN